MKAKPASKVLFHFLLRTFNLQQRTTLKAFIEQRFKKEGVKLRSLHFIFCSDDYLLEVNRQFLQHDYYTDIITFNLASDKAVEAEVYISIDRVRENATKYATSFKEELHRVIFHGVLHLCGYKDKTRNQEKEMRRKESAYLGDYFGK